jgi:hypothetical protein
MRYLILIYGNWDAWNGIDEALGKRIMAAHVALSEDLTASGELIETQELRPEGAKTVRVKGGAVSVTDEPFIEVKEIVAGYYIVECASIDRAVEIAGRLVEAEFAPIEVRPIGA